MSELFNQKPSPEQQPMGELEVVDQIRAWGEAIINSPLRQAPYQVTLGWQWAQWDSDKDGLRLELWQVPIPMRDDSTAFSYLLKEYQLFDSSTARIHYSLRPAAIGVQRFVDKQPAPTNNDNGATDANLMLARLKAAKILHPADRSPRDIASNPQYLRVIYEMLVEDIPNLPTLAERFQEIATPHIRRSTFNEMKALVTVHALIKDEEFARRLLYSVLRPSA